jgi:hypothetical protein
MLAVFCDSGHTQPSEHLPNCERRRGRKSRHLGRSSARFAMNSVIIPIFRGSELRTHGRLAGFFERTAVLYQVGHTRTSFQEVRRVVSDSDHSAGFIVPANTSPNAATIGCTRGTGLTSIGEDRRDIPLPCRTCSTNDRTHRTSDLPCGATSRRAGSGCVVVPKR